MSAFNNGKSPANITFEYQQICQFSFKTDKDWYFQTKNLYVERLIVWNT